MADVEIDVLGGDQGTGREDVAGVWRAGLQGEDTFDRGPAAVVYRVYPPLREVVDGDDDADYSGPSYRKVSVEVDTWTWNGLMRRKMTWRVCPAKAAKCLPGRFRYSWRGATSAIRRRQDTL